MSLKLLYKTIVRLFVLLLIVGSCANPVAPTGGPKDETPPVFLGSDPVNRSRNFHSDRIRMSFDEFVVLKDLNKQLLISPPMKNKPEIRTKGKGVQVKMNPEEQLQENTTYTIYFGDAIVDLHESNPLSNFQYVFSTGPEIDSLSIRGKVVSADYLLPEEGVFVCLYINNNDTIPLDSLPQTVRPYYVAKTNKDGLFEINNIRKDNYLIFAVRDANANYINDMPNETIAFDDKLVLPEEVYDYLPDTIPVDTANHALMDSLWANYAVPVTKQMHTLLMYEPQDSVQKVLETNVIDENRLNITFKYPLKKEVAIQVLKPEGKTQQEVLLAEYSNQKDSLDLWFYKPFADTIRFQMLVDTLKADTLEVVLNTKSAAPQAAPVVRRGRGNKQASESKSARAYLEYSTNIKNPFPYFGRARITFKTPLSKANFENVKLYEDSVEVPVKLHFADSVKRKLDVTYTWKESADYRFVIPDLVLTDIYGTQNDSIILPFKTTEESNYGELMMGILLPDSTSYPWIVQLIKGTEENEKLLSKHVITKSGEVTFPNLPEEKYRIKILEDRDGNGRWSSGNYRQNRLPERVFYYDKTLEIKPGWKVEERWHIDTSKQENNGAQKDKDKSEKSEDKPKKRESGGLRSSSGFSSAGR